MNPGEADRILYNGTIVTVDSANTVAEAVAVKDGRIAAVGTEDEVMQWRGAGTELTDLEGKTALPGFVEPHSHLSFVGVKLNVANVSPPPWLPPVAPTRAASTLSVAITIRVSWAVSRKIRTKSIFSGASSSPRTMWPRSVQPLTPPTSSERPPWPRQSSAATV